MSQKTIDRIIELAESLTPEEVAQVAGKLLDWADVTLTHFEAFIAELDPDNREELAIRFEELEEQKE